MTDMDSEAEHAAAKSDSSRHPPLPLQQTNGDPSSVQAGGQTPAPYPRIKNAVLLLLLLLGLQLVLGFALGIVLALAGLALNGLTLSIINILSFAAVILIAVKKMHVPLFSVLNVEVLHAELIFPILVSCCGFSILLSEINNLTQLLLPMRGFWSTFFRAMFIPERILSSLVLFVVVAPITEELLFRRIILDGFLRNYRAVAAIVLSSLFFGLVHLNPWQFITSFLLALYLSWLYLKTRSLFLCIVGHAFNNFIPMAVIGMAKLNIPGYSGESATRFQPVWFDLLGVLLAGAGLYLTYRVVKQLESGFTPPRRADAA